ncbi:helix-turn-helix domain-containing protein [Rhizobium azibense]|uniref:Excisionase family DNA binding protein n=1 Tax=Rhizobium azibense TaxID=1136135 RepID=A0A4R3RTA9_9HYPH|nr:helix-turn-helix domain-containing protein [Rhizobium azibense]TCU38761.1 excisionase family DNA binding protein [Rhizobium azibense]
MTDNRAVLDELIEGARRHLDGLLALRAKMAGERVSEAEDDFAPENLLDASTAAQRFGFSKQTIRRWVKDHSIGFKRGGRLLVSVPRLRRHIGDA